MTPCCLSGLHAAELWSCARCRTGVDALGKRVRAFWPAEKKWFEVGTLFHSFGCSSLIFPHGRQNKLWNIHSLMWTDQCLSIQLYIRRGPSTNTSERQTPTRSVTMTATMSTSSFLTAQLSSFRLCRRLKTLLCPFLGQQHPLHPALVVCKTLHDTILKLLYPSDTEILLSFLLCKDIPNVTV